MRRTIRLLVLLCGCALAHCRPDGGLHHARDDGADCDEGAAAACFRLGKRWSRPTGEPGGRYRAWRYLKMACEGRHGPGCQALRRLDEAACSSGNARGCWNLGETYRLGKQSIARDLPRARRYYHASCRDGFARGCYQLGVLLYQGRGGRANPARARALFRKACKRKHPEACARIGR